MKKHVYTFILALFLIGLSNGQAAAQCSGGTLAGNISMLTTFQTIGCITGGQYYTFNAIAGSSYLFSFCQGGGTASFDSQITILDNTGAYAGGYNDDNCGLQSEVSWNAPSTGVFRVLVNNYSCIAGATCATLAYRENPPLGAGSTCLTPQIIPSLPFNQTGQTTCGYGDDYSSVDACGDSYMNGDDFVYAYTSAGNEEITITLTNTGTWVGLFVMDGCPNAVGTTCMPLSGGGGGGGCAAVAGGSNTNSAGNPFGTWELCNPGTYYIIISTFPAPQCTAFDINITSVASTCSGPASGTFCYSTGATPYSPYSFTSGTAVSFDDDEFSDTSFPIGFSFCYSGITYTQFVISSNGYINFNTNCITQYSPYVTVALPNAAEVEVENSILLSWCDIDPDPFIRPDYIRYAVYGLSPNRRLAVSFDRIPMFSSSCIPQIYTGQLVLEETTNNIYMYIQEKTVCTAWNSGNAVQGLVSTDGTQTLITAGRNNTNWSATNDARMFSPTCAPCLIVLPVRYADFSGRRLESSNLLEWETAEETSMDHFVIERSSDGRNFEEIGKTVAKGSPSQSANYQFEDRHPVDQISYYRLREMDLNGNESYSQVVTITQDGSTFSIENMYYNVDAHNVTVDVNIISPTQKLNAEIHDLAGRKLASGEFWFNQGSQSFAMDASNLSAGYYLLSVYDGGSQRITKRFVKR